MSTIPLSVLDLIPVSSGQDAGRAVANTLDLARRAEAAGYHRYWIAEHHLNDGVIGSAPVVAIALVAAATSSIRVGSGAVLAGNHTPLSLVEQFGLIDAAHPGRLDLGLGRSANRRPVDGSPSSPPASLQRADIAPRAANGLPLPPPPSLAGLFGSDRYAAQQRLLSRGTVEQEYADQVAEILALLDGSHRIGDVEVHASPGEGADLAVWILGSSGGESARLAGRLGLPFGANYHVAPQRVIEAVEAYRSAFVPSPRLAEPRVIVSADVLVADTDEVAAHLAAGYGPWVHSIRSGAGAIRYPTPREAAEIPWGNEEHELVADRLATRFVGGPATVTAGLRQLTDATGADELLITSIAHDHDDRVRSHELLAEHWRNS